MQGRCWRAGKLRAELLFFDLVLTGLGERQWRMVQERTSCWSGSKPQRFCKNTGRNKQLNKFKRELTVGLLRGLSADFHHLAIIGPMKTRGPTQP